MEESSLIPHEHAQKGAVAALKDLTGLANVVLRSVLMLRVPTIIRLINLLEPSRLVSRTTPANKIF